MEEAFVWTDSRYYIQAEKQLDPQCFKFMKLEEKPWFETITQPIHIGFDPSLLSAFNVEVRSAYFKAKNVEFVPIEENLIDLVWDNKPKRPELGIFELEAEFCGETVAQKMEKLK